MDLVLPIAQVTAKFERSSVVASLNVLLLASLVANPLLLLSTASVDGFG